MNKFLLVHTWLLAKFKYIAIIIALVVGAGRYMVCRSFGCAMSYFFTAYLIAMLAFGVYKAVVKKFVLSKIIAPIVPDVEEDKNDVVELDNVKEVKE